MHVCVEEFKKQRLESELEALHDRLLDAQRIDADHLSRLAHQRYPRPSAQLRSHMCHGTATTDRRSPPAGCFFCWRTL